MSRKILGKYTTTEGILFVEIIKPTKEEIDSYYVEDSGEKSLKSSGSSESSAVVFKKAIVKYSFNTEKYPIDSLWMMGQSPGIKINFFGEHLTVIQEKDLYARIN